MDSGSTTRRLCASSSCESHNIICSGDAVSESFLSSASASGRAFWIHFQHLQRKKLKTRMGVIQQVNDCYSLIFMSFFQLLPPMCASNTLVQWARVIVVLEILPTWFRVDHNVSSISPSDWPAPTMNVGENLAKQMSWCPWAWNKPIPWMMMSSGWKWRNGDSLTRRRKFLKYWQLTS